MSARQPSSRQLQTQRRNASIRKAFRERYTEAPRPRKYSREYVLAKLSEEYFLSIATIEDVVYSTATDSTADNAVLNGKTSSAPETAQQ